MLRFLIAIICILLHIPKKLTLISKVNWRMKTNDLVIFVSFGVRCKVSFFGMCSKMQIIPIKNLNIKKVVPQFLWFFRLKCWFKGQIISRIHLSLPNAYKLICFDRNINGNRNVNFLTFNKQSEKACMCF